MSREKAELSRAGRILVGAFLFGMFVPPLVVLAIKLNIWLWSL